MHVAVGTPPTVPDITGGKVSKTRAAAAFAALGGFALGALTGLSYSPPRQPEPAYMTPFSVTEVTSPTVPSCATGDTLYRTTGNSTTVTPYEDPAGRKPSSGPGHYRTVTATTSGENDGHVDLTFTAPKGYPIDKVVVQQMPVIHKTGTVLHSTEWVNTTPSSVVTVPNVWAQPSTIVWLCLHPGTPR
mgnify:CR=1 FL=1